MKKVIFSVCFSVVMALLLVGLLAEDSGFAASTTGSTDVEAEFVVMSDTDVFTPTDTVLLPLVANNYASAPPETLFGVQMYGVQARNANSLGLARVARVSWIRWPMLWRQVEPVNTTPDQYQWGVYDTTIGNATASGHKLILRVCSNPDWAATYQQGPIDKVDLSEFVEFVGELVERYDGDNYRDAPGSPVVNYWEFYNEPDAYNRWAAEQGYGGYWGMHGDQYAEMLCAVYPVIKVLAPDAQVVLGGIAYDSFMDQGGSFYREFIDDVLTHGGGACFDYMNFHYYPAFEPTWSAYGNGLTGKANYLAAKLAQYGVSKPMVVTEAGWHSNYYSDAFPGSPEIQSRYVVKLFVQAAAANLKALTWWTWVDPGLPNGENGLVTTLLEPKMSFTVYQYAAGRIGLAQFVQIEPTASVVEGYRFIAPNGLPFYVFWSKDAQSHTIAISANQARLVNMHGQTIRVAHDGDDGIIDGRMHFTVDANPIYVELEW
jgi:hypothetical protein